MVRKKDFGLIGIKKTDRKTMKEIIRMIRKKDYRRGGMKMDRKSLKEI